LILNHGPPPQYEKPCFFCPPHSNTLTEIICARALAPDHLEPPEAELWGAITSTYAIDDAAALELLDAALQARGRMRRCRAQIDKDGEALKDRWGQTRAHPLLIAERGARDSFLKAMRLLNLDTSGTD
jgi:hypothetical protein